MLITDTFERSGNFLFRWRGYLPLFFLALTFAVLYFNDTNYEGLFSSDNWSYICLLVGMIGIVIRFITVSYVTHLTSGRGTDKPYAERLNTTGMYSMSRNPVYLGNFFTFLAPVLYARNLWLIALYLPIFALYHERIIFAEESFLKRKFGQQYISWADKTPVFFPNFSLWQSPDLTFSLKMGIRRESISFFTLVSTVWALKLADDYITHGYVIFEPIWLTLFIVSFLIYFAVILLVQFSHFLDR